MKFFRLAIACLFVSGHLLAQSGFVYRPQAHSHNDYEQARPFEAAWDLGFGSIEADVYVQEGELMVAHDRKDIRPERTFRSLYLTPLLRHIADNKGFPYPKKKELQLMIDLKDAAALPVLEKQLLEHAKELRHVHVVVSGAMPAPADFGKYDPIISFDGRITTTYPAEARKRVPLVSASFTEFGKYWPGKEALSPEIRQKLVDFVREAHARGQKTRVWGTPNTDLGYRTLREIGLDYIGSDELPKLAAILP